MVKMNLKNNFAGMERSAYYRQCGKAGQFQPLHCTAMFTNKGKAPRAREYMALPVVVQNMGRGYNLIVSYTLLW